MALGITRSGVWVGFGSRSGGLMWPAPEDDTSGVWRPPMEMLMAETMGYRHGVGCANGTIGIELGLRVQFRARGAQWAVGRREVLVPDFTCVPALEPFLSAVEREFGFSPRLVMFDAVEDGTMDSGPVADYLRERADRVLAVSPVTQYGNYGDVGAFVELGERYGVAVHLDDARGGAARREGRRPATASVSFHAHAKTTPAPEGGVMTTDDDELAYYMRVMTDCGTPPPQVDHIPAFDRPAVAVGNKRLGEHAAGIAILSWLRAMNDSRYARVNRLAIQELIADEGRFGDTPVLSNAPFDPGVVRAPMYKLLLICTEHLEQTLGLTPEGLRRYLVACGIPAEQPDTPAHQLPAWSQWTEGREFPVAERLYQRGILVHTAFLRDRRFAGWFTAAIDQLLEQPDTTRRLYGLH